ncbi:MAG: LruC domain-containing protein [Bacteroidota bacterium]
MNHLYLKQRYVIVVLMFIAISCNETIEKDLEMYEASEELNFPNEFNFETSRNLSIETNESGNPFELSFQDNNGVEYLIGKFNNSGRMVTVTIPSYVTKLSYTELTENDATSTKLPIGANQMQLSLPALSKSGGRVTDDNNCIDRLYAVNSQAGFYEINVTSDEYVTNQLTNLPGGSIANALDQENGLVYINVNKTLYRYDVESETFEVAFTSNPYNGSYPRFEYKDGVFYMGNNTSMYTVDAATNQVIQKYSISGFVNSNAGGDLAFDSNGTLYLACFSGLYKFTELNDETGVASLTRVSAENFPFQLTSMAIDRQDRIYVGTNDANSRLIEISKEDGSYQVVQTYNHKINDLTAWKCDFSNLGSSESDSDNDGDGVPNEEDDDMDGDGIIDEKDDDVDGDGTLNTEDDDMDGDGTPNEEDPDIDGDGVINPLDEYPEDPMATGNIYTPSKLGYGSLAFEDNWPSKGDYDFNDLVIRYKVNALINRDNNVARMIIELRLVAAGGEFQNGFGIQLPMVESVIESVTGHNAPASMVNVKGLENGQGKPTVIAFTNSLAELGGGNIINADPGKAKVDERVYTIVVDFNELIPASSVAGAPYNPFIFINNERGRECHLRNKLPTDLADLSYMGVNDDLSVPEQGRYYVSDKRVPFAINIAHQFRYPIEGTRIDRAYNYFVNWGESSGISYSDWYTDAGGNRNTSEIYLK